MEWSILCGTSFQATYTSVRGQCDTYENDFAQLKADAMNKEMLAAQTLGDDESNGALLTWAEKVPYNIAEGHMKVAEFAVELFTLGRAGERGCGN